MNRAHFQSLLPLSIAAVILACGPELTERANTNVTGIWVGTGKVVTITDIRAEITQDAASKLTGRWSGKATPPPNNCPPDIGLAPSNILFGSNSIAQVEFQLLGAGQYNGALVSETQMEGRVRSCGRFYRLDFERLTPEVTP